MSSMISRNTAVKRGLAPDTSRPLHMPRPVIFRAPSQPGGLGLSRDFNGLGRRMSRQHIFVK